ncbi:hypothetical protein H181DRAFT_02826 [Streptomyces sp. WMMB 714]|nr:hypothetical protein H181DRAFT_02826 [Streptomyces sp. WMMB 714]
MTTARLRRSARHRIQAAGAPPMCAPRVPEREDGGAP